MLRRTFMRGCGVTNVRLAPTAPAAVGATGKPSVVTPAIDPVPTPVEAPHLLEAALNEPKPFLQPRALKAFSVSLLIGAGFAASVYVLLSKSISDQYTEEKELLEQITERRRRREHVAEASKAMAQSAKDSLLNGGSNAFTAPSRFEDVQKRANEAQLNMNRSSNETTSAAPETPMLHQEAVFRAKKGWNDAISNVQMSLEAFDTEYRRRREASAVEGVKQLIRDRGYDEQSLRRI